MNPSTDATACIVAPAWLHEPLSVQLQAAPGVRLWASTTSVTTLFWAAIEPPPELVLLYASSQEAAGQVRELKSAWPETYCIVLVEQAKLEPIALEAGADEVLLEGRAPHRLLATLNSFSKRRQESIQEQPVPERQADLGEGASM